MKIGSNSAPIWGIHAGRKGEAAPLFLDNSRIALGWHAVGDLSNLSPDRDTFKAAVAKAYPNAKPGAIPNYAGLLYRFLLEMKEGDLVVFPHKQTRKLHVGKVIGGYEYLPGLNQEFPNTRKVEWIKDFSRTQFSQGALYEVGSALSLFQIKNYADEFVAALEGKVLATVSEEDESVEVVAEAMEDTTRDFVIKRLAQELKGLPLEDFVKHLLECMGYQARLTRKNEPSVDVIAHKDPLGIEPPIIKVQVKSGLGTITDKDVSALYGKLSIGEYGLFVTLGSFSPPCRNFEQGKGNLRLIDGDELVDLIFQYYEHFDSRYKSVLPMKRIYVPEVLDASGE